MAGKTQSLTGHVKQLFETEMDNFFSLFRRYLNDKAKGNEVYVTTRPLSPATTPLISPFQLLGPHCAPR